MQRARWSGYLAVIVILAGVYYAAARLGLRLAFENPSATPVWPPSGIALAAVLLFGYRASPGILLGAFLANFMTAGTVVTSLGIAAGNTLEAVLGGFLVNRFAGGRRAFDGSRDFFRFVVLAGILSTIVSATFGVTSLALGGFARWSAYGSIWFTWWVGDAVGDLIVAPALVLWSRPRDPRWSRGRVLEAAFLLAGLLVVGVVVFGAPFSLLISKYPLPFLCIPFLVWAAFRLGQRETAAACVVLSAIAVRGTLAGYGPFATGRPNVSLLLLQAFLAVSALLAMSLAALVSERTETRQALERKAAELARSNAELEQFVYVASHDLKEPLRMVSRFLELLAKRYRGRLDKEADEFIEFAVDGATRMSRLIDDLLRLSRVVTTERPAAPTPSGAALERVLGDMAPSLAESGAVVTHGEMPLVACDATQLAQLFQNLIGNAVKFRSAGRPEVHVTAERAGGSWLFSVRDNGIGVPALHAERIFKIFQRLHSREAYPGTGIGLAICKKIVERLGGCIWVEPGPDRGSIFRFTLPAADIGPSAIDSPGIDSPGIGSTGIGSAA